MSEDARKAAFLAFAGDSGAGLTSTLQEICEKIAAERPEDPISFAATLCEREAIQKSSAKEEELT